MAFLHGVETIEIDQKGRPVTIVKAGVITLVGIAPIGAVNEPILVLSPNDAAQFGQQLAGFTIPQALDAIFKQGPATVIVVNTFDSVDNVSQITTESQTITGGKLKLNFNPVSAVTILESDGITPWDGVSGTDYSLDAFGNFKALSSVASESLVLKFTYKKLDTGTLTSGQIIGDNVAGVRTGIKCWELVFNTFGFYPKILIAPGFSTMNAVASELIAVAPKYRAIALIDAPIGTTVVQGVAGRGPASTINFKTSSDRAYLLMPHLKVYNADTDSNINAPYSQFMAGVMSNVDYWISPSNREILGIVGVEYVVTASVNDINSEANLLNSNGITTTFSGYGTGTRTWGNRSASYPTNTDQKNFIPIRRLADIVHESLEQASLQFIDKPLNQATIDAIRDTGNGFFKTLIGRGACLPGSKVIYNPADNSAEELSAGHVVFELDFAGASPAERITFKSVIDINLLTQLV